MKDPTLAMKQSKTLKNTRSTVDNSKIQDNYSDKKTPDSESTVMIEVNNCSAV